MVNWNTSEDFKLAVFQCSISFEQETTFPNSGYNSKQFVFGVPIQVKDTMLGSFTVVNICYGASGSRGGETFLITFYSLVLLDKTSLVSLILSLSLSVSFYLSFSLSLSLSLSFSLSHVLALNLRLKFVKLSCKVLSSITRSK